MRKTIFIAILFCLLSVSARAELIYVDPACGSITTYVPSSHACTGGSARSYATITNALAYSSLGGSDDDQVLIRTGTYSENALMSGKSGTSGHQVVIRPYQSETVTLNSANIGGSGACLALLNSSYVTVQGLNFVGTSRNTPRFALQSKASTADVIGVVFTGNTVTNWGTGGSLTNIAAIEFESADAVAWVNRNGTISNNTLTGNKSDGIKLRSSYDTVIDGNDISNMVCGQTGASEPPQQVGIKQAGNNSGSGASLSSSRNTVSNNHIHDFPERNACSLGLANSRAIYGDVAATFATISNNRIHDLSVNSASNAVSGIEVESRCNDWTIKENIIYRTGGTGIQNGSDSHAADRTQILNNVVFSVTNNAIDLRCGGSLVVKNNAADNGGLAQIELRAGAINGTGGTCTGYGNHTIDYNDYWDLVSGNKVGRYAGGATTNFATWKANCSCDSHSKNVTPLFQSTTTGSENFHLQAASTLIGAGSGGVDMGAYPLGSGSTPPPFIPPFSIDLTSPNGGEFLTPGTVFPITYNSNALVGFTIAAFSHNAADPGEDSTGGANQTVLYNTHRSEASFLVEYGIEQTLSASWVTNKSNAGIAFSVSSSSATVTCDDCNSSGGGVSSLNIVTGKIPLGNTPYLVIVDAMISAGSPPPTVNEPALTGTNGWNVTWTRPVNGTITHNETGGTQHRITAFQGVIGNSPASGNLAADFAGQTQTRVIWSVLRLPDADRTTPLVEVKPATDAAGTSMDIVLDSAPSAGGLKIEFSQDNGANYSTIAASVSNTGVYYWTVPRGASTTCKIKISAAADPTNNDVSDGVFKIKGRYLGASP